MNSAGTSRLVMNKPHAVLPADQKVLMAFMSQLILCQYATGTIGKFLSCIVTKHRQFGYPSPLVYREMGSWLMGLKKNTSSGVKTKMLWTPIHMITSLPTTSLLHEHNRSLYNWAPWAHFGNPSGAMDVCDCNKYKRNPMENQWYGTTSFSLQTPRSLKFGRNTTPKPTIAV